MSASLRAKSVVAAISASAARICCGVVLPRSNDVA
jgi:hypothetical protein